MYMVKIPATSGNMGVGFDCAGMALNIYNTVEFEAREQGLVIEVPGDLDGSIPRDEQNMVYRAANVAARRIGKPLGGLFLRQYGDIPMASGLGSSAACAVAGIYIADTLLNGGLSPAEMLELATDMEGHPDNAAPAIYGGVCISVREGSRLSTIRLPLSGELPDIAVMTPRFPLSTSRSRASLPREIPLCDAASNIARMGILVSAFYERDFSWLRTALHDKLHEPYRKSLVKGYDQIVHAARRAGAYGVCLSGAGPTMLAFVPAEHIRFPEAMQRALAGIPGGWQLRMARISGHGAAVLEQ